MKRVHATGHMQQAAIEKGGSWYQARLELENLCKDAGVRCTVKPFDVYQGPYADCGDGIQVWLGEGEDNFDIINSKKSGEDKVVYEGPYEGAVDRLRTVKGKHLSLVKSVAAKYRVEEK